ncbi:prepilin-type N-terminal cleavage/methylation domain-containing protein [Marinihelvus fidelis]|uniref:Type II secretion system protein H n=1 Tax=Marinihelvus fidelis TaxID=2613842 RepID=A0A5N0TDG9_9GAMM|nr:GspH/FimT family pseudopilin [Marinihelvus fidelis]KAA9133133.1 prepilin-type N-terminal cleavage/methylation domain-containing protein [Marinihelvus fidelis]
MNSIRRSAGFTLLELVIVIAVVAITVSLAAPSLVQTIRNNEVSSQGMELLGMLNLAKSEAVRRNTEVTLTLVTDSEGWDGFIEDPNNTAEIEGCVTGQLRCTFNENVALTGVSEVSFNNRGYIRNADDTWAGETFYLQHEQCSGDRQRRRVDITPTGQISSCQLACNSTAACP